MKGCRACGNLFIVLFMAARLIIAELERGSLEAPHEPNPSQSIKSSAKSGV